MQTKQKEKQSDDQQLIALLKQHSDILLRHPDILTELQIPHESGAAISLIERQIELLREKIKTVESRMRELMDIARDNERLAESRHRIAVNLLGAHDKHDVISIVLDELGNELKAEYAVIKLISDDAQQLKQRPELFVAANTRELNVFSTMLKHKNPVCGRSSKEQKAFLFGKDAAQVESAAIIPLVAGADLGLLGLGSQDPQRFHSTKGLDFLRHIGELISAALAVHLEKKS